MFDGVRKKTNLRGKKMFSFVLLWILQLMENVSGLQVQVELKE